MTSEFGRGVLVGVLICSLIGGLSYGVYSLVWPFLDGGVEQEIADSDAEPGELHCSFCGKNQAEVKKLIAGPSVYICEECVGLCNEIIATEDAEWGAAQCKLMTGGGESGP